MSASRLRRGRAILCRMTRLAAALGVAAACVAAGASTGGATQDGASAASRPPIVQRPIPFDAKRRSDTAAYSRRHYGAADWRLRPRVIVQHATATAALEPVIAAFSRNVADPELHELPGTCAHFVIDRDGTIFQLVPLHTRCRHTVGLNSTAIGIEHVGTSSAAVLRNAQQRQASLALTLWLADRYDIALADVIGHNENVRSPYHRERYAAWRCQTHADFPTREMTSYRRTLAQVAAGARVRLRARSLPAPPPRCG